MILKEVLKLLEAKSAELNQTENSRENKAAPPDPEKVRFKEALDLTIEMFKDADERELWG